MKKQHKIGNGCMIGNRTYAPDHPTCKSCERQGAANCSKPKTVKLPGVIRTWHEGKTLKTTAYLYSVNHWHGKDRHVYLKEKKKWQEVFTGTWALWGVQKDEKRFLTVRRYVKSKGNLINDQDNISAAMKPVLDALRKVGVLKDDTTNHVEFQIEQIIDPLERVEFEFKEV